MTEPPGPTDKARVVHSLGLHQRLSQPPMDRSPSSRILRAGKGTGFLSSLALLLTNGVILGGLNIYAHNSRTIILILQRPFLFV